MIAMCLRRFLLYIIQIEHWSKQSLEVWQGCKWLESVLLKIPQLNQDNLSDMIIENNKIEVRYHREMSLCNFRLDAAYQQFSIDSTNIYSKCTSGNDEKTCRKKCAINWETNLHNNNVTKLYKILCNYNYTSALKLHKCIININVYFKWESGIAQFWFTKY